MQAVPLAAVPGGSRVASRSRCYWMTIFGKAWL